MTETKIIETRTHGRYLVRRGESSRLLVGFHGYGENAERHLAELEKLDGGWTLVAIQALNRFYTRTEEIVANWMTREDREIAIDDNIHYVRRVIEELRPYEKLVFAGFSQGAAMAYRAAASIRCDGVFVLAGDLPPDVAVGLSRGNGEGSAGQVADGSFGVYASQDDRRPFPVLIGRGERDDWYTDEKLKKDLNFLPQAETCVFDGRHEWSDSFRAAASEFLSRLK
jgi:predicted esterase